VCTTPLPAALAIARIAIGKPCLAARPCTGVVVVAPPRPPIIAIYDKPWMLWRIRRCKKVPNLS
jgi:hypothetical protein